MTKTMDLLSSLPLLPEEKTQRPEGDWLLEPQRFKAGAYRGNHGKEIVLTNGLISRTWRLAPNGATVGYENLMTGQTVIRGVKPEAAVGLGGSSWEGTPCWPAGGSATSRM